MHVSVYVCTGVYVCACMYVQILCMLVCKYQQFVLVLLAALARPPHPQYVE